MTEEKLRELIIKVLGEMGVQGVGVGLERPADEKHGDYSSNVAMSIFSKFETRNLESKDKETKGPTFGSPRELAQNIAKKIKDDHLDRLDWLDNVEVAGPGFVNFRLSEQYLLSELGRVVGGELGLERKGKGKVVVEYSSPNIAKPFTIGHLRSTIIGDAIANILEYVGWEVYRDNHLGDWGTQFGKQIYAIKEWGDGKKIENSEQPVKELVELYVKFHEEAENNPDLNEKGREWFKKLEDGDKEARLLWQKCVDWSWKEFERIYQILGVEFTENSGKGYGESFFEDMMAAVIDELEKKGILKEGEGGAKLVFFSEEKRMPPLMLVKSDGASLYATRDLATDKFRLAQHGPDVVVINEVGAEQELYWRQVIEVEEMLGWYKSGQRVHIRHGHFRFADKKMSTRKGNVIWLEDVLGEAVKRAWNLQKVESKFVGTQTVESRSLKQTKGARSHMLRAGRRAGLAEVVGIGALKWNDLKGSTNREIVFDWDEVLNMQGNSGPYVQYTYARAKSVLHKASEKLQLKSQSEQDLLVDKSLGELVSELGLDGLGVKDMVIGLNDEERAVLVHLMRFGEVVQRAAGEYAPHLVCGYLYELAQKFNSFYNRHQILEKQEIIRPSGLPPRSRSTHDDKITPGKFGDLVKFRLVMTAGVARVLKEGLSLLGIEAPERM